MAYPLFLTLVFLLPLQLGKHFFPPISYIYGLPVDYLSPTLYFTDILLLLLIIISHHQLIRFISRLPRHYLVFFFSLILLNLLISPSILTLLAWIRILLLLCLAIYAYTLPQTKFKFIYYPLALSLLFISSLGIAQFFLTASLDGPFYYLGERHFTLTTPGIAKTIIAGRPFLRAYSLFSHPNSFAGFLLVAILILSRLHSVFKIRVSPHFHRLVILITLIALILTFSKAALIALLLLPLLYLFKPSLTHLFIFYLLSTILLITASLILPLDHSWPQFIYQRLFLNQAAVNIILHHPLLGIGLNQFIPALATTYPQSLLLQPVHHLLLLLLSQIGIIGLLLTLYLFKPIYKRIPINVFSLCVIFVFLVTGLFDHYWFTLHQNQLLLFLTLPLLLRL